MNSNVDQYLIDGCGRCQFYKTPQCKVHSFANELRLLRDIVLDSNLKEEYKWSQPCYTFNGKNVLIVTAFKEYACISFFKGALLEDKKEILIKPGRSSQSARQIRFTSTKEIKRLKNVLGAYIKEAIEIEKEGKKVIFKEQPEAMPIELLEFFDRDKKLKKAFESLTPGRQRGYIMHFSQPKQSKTRTNRIEKWIPKILNGEGMHDAYRKSK